MNYTKPEITVLGTAACTIQGSNNKDFETAAPHVKDISDCELDD